MSEIEVEVSPGEIKLTEQDPLPQDSQKEIRSLMVDFCKNTTLFDLLPEHQKIVVLH